MFKYLNIIVIFIVLKNQQYQLPKKGIRYKNQNTIGIIAKNYFCKVRDIVFESKVIEHRLTL